MVTQPAMPRWFSHGEETDAIAINDRGFQYGDGLFETIAIRDGKPRLWTLHKKRLQTGCRRLGIDVPNATNLLQQISAVIEKTGKTDADALLKVIVTRGQGKRGYAPPAAAEPTLLIGIFEYSKSPAHYYRDGVVARVCSARLSMQAQTAGIKLLSRLDQVRARGEWNDPGIAEGLMLDQSGSLICGTISNLFLLRDSCLVTPEITHCGVSGIMRQHILSLAQQHGLAYEVTPISLENLYTADEIFLCNSQFGIWPVAVCGHKRIDVWPLTQKLRALLKQSGVDEGPE